MNRTGRGEVGRNDIGSNRELSGDIGKTLGRRVFMLDLCSNEINGHDLKLIEIQLESCLIKGRNCEKKCCEEHNMLRYVGHNFEKRMLVRL